MGETGLGKTHLSLAIANRVLEKGYDVYYDSIQSIMYKLEKEHFKGNGDGHFLEDVLECDVLIIDDILTTGITLENCALALKNAGVEEVCAITVFIAD